MIKMCVVDHPKQFSKRKFFSGDQWHTFLPVLDTLLRPRLPRMREKPDPSANTGYTSATLVRMKESMFVSF